MENKRVTNDRKVILSTLWVFYVLNILYADILTLMAGTTVTTAEDVQLVNTLLSPIMLLVIGFFLEMAMAMIVLSRLLKHGINRWANIIVAIIHIFVLLASLLVGTPPMFYIFFVIIEVITCLFIVWYAWSWKNAI